jgi:hypothetical protein
VWFLHGIFSIILEHFINNPKYYSSSSVFSDGQTCLCNVHCHLVELLQVTKQLLLDFGSQMDSPASVMSIWPDLIPSVLQVSGILWGHCRLSLALCCRDTCRSHQFQTYGADDVVVYSGLFGGGIWSLLRPIWIWSLWSILLWCVQIA